MCTLRAKWCTKLKSRWKEGQLSRVSGLSAEGIKKKVPERSSQVEREREIDMCAKIIGKTQAVSHLPHSDASVTGCPNVEQLIYPVFFLSIVALQCSVKQLLCFSFEDEGLS